MSEVEEFRILIRFQNNVEDKTRLSGNLGIYEGHCIIFYQVTLYSATDIQIFNGGIIFGGETQKSIYEGKAK